MNEKDYILDLLYKGIKYYPDRKCSCGCLGKIEVQKHHMCKGIPDFIHGHNGRGKTGYWARKKLSEEHIKKISETKKGKKCSEETSA